jgi:hypothetical protein
MDKQELEPHMSTTTTGARHDRSKITAIPRVPGQVPDSDWDDSFDQALATELGRRATRRLAPPERRGQVVSAFFVACYAGLIIPVVGVGVASGFTGTFPAVLAFSLLLAALCLFSLARIATALAPDRTGR